MIIARLRYGLGNQLYQYAIAKHLALKNNTELKLDLTYCRQFSPANSHAYYRLGEFNIDENFATEEELSKIKLVKQKGANDGFVPEILNLPDNVCLQGLWMNELYFRDIRDILLKEFTLKNPLHKNSAEWKEKIISSDVSVSLHIRFGDYISTMWRNGFDGLISADFYHRCVEELKKFFPQFTIFVFSDNLSLAKRILKFDVPVEFVEGCETDAEELYLMSLCKHNIIPKSTFSWWAAWLNQNPDKKIFSVVNTNDRYFDCIKIEETPVVNPDFALDPLFSIILYVEDDISTVDSVTESIWAQNFSDYEVIIIDASADGSGKICRKFAQKDNVTILRTSYDKNKFAAWNMGLKNARGSYVLFLTCKDFMFSHAGDLMFARILEHFLKYYDSDENRTVEFGTWYNQAKDIICSVQSVEEFGEILNKSDLPSKEKFKFNNVMNLGINGKKFSLKIDEDFKNIERNEKLIADSVQKLRLLADKKLNTLFCTKIFKRKFLTENNIRFRENLGSDSELLFLAETFLQTEEIMLVDRTFCGTFK